MSSNVHRCDWMSYEDFLKVASIQKSVCQSVFWQDSKGRYQIKVDGIKWMTDGEAYRYVYNRYIATQPRPQPHQPAKGRVWYPTITTPDSPVADLVREKCEADR